MEDGRQMLRARLRRTRGSQARLAFWNLQWARRDTDVTTASISELPPLLVKLLRDMSAGSGRYSARRRCSHRRKFAVAGTVGRTKRESFG
jgi:hypothetical protein